MGYVVGWNYAFSHAAASQKCNSKLNVDCCLIAVLLIFIYNFDV